MAPPTPTQTELVSWYSSLSTWGRWGPDDDLGTLNYIGDRQRTRAMALAEEGSVVSCALPLETSTVALPDVSPGPRAQRVVITDGTDQAPPGSRVVAYDALFVAPHGPIVTHLDAPRHTVVDGTSYNGLPAGAPGPRGTIAAAGQGIVGRGVLLDVPRCQGRDWLDDGEPILPQDLEACEAAGSIRVEAGDILFVRTGYRARMPGGPAERHAPRPGLQAACLPWLHEREVAVVASDVAVDVIPHGYDDIGLPIHAIGMWAMGLWLVDNCQLESLGNACDRLDRWEFLAVLAPLPIQDATASPVNPMALF